jgi:hypothetical protein
MDHSTASEIVKWAMVGLLALGVLLTITNVGKPRKPMTGSAAAKVALVSVAEIIGIVLLWGTS